MSAIKYTCDFCQKEYSRKGDLTRHINRKICGPPIEMAERIEDLVRETIDVKTQNKDVIKKTLSKLLWSILDILRDNEGLTGEKAFRNMSYFLILKLIEPHLGKEIDIDNYKYDFSRIEDDQVEAHKTELLRIVRFSNLAKENKVDLQKSLKDLWEDILSVHPSTKGVFLEDKRFDIKAVSAYKRIISKLDTVDLCSVDNDILGDVYEDAIKDIMTGKVLGQFFTPPAIKKMIIKLINPQLHADGKIDTCCDPTMGTGGFLIEYIRHIKKQATNKNIKIDWEYIKNEGLYGKELEPDTYQLAVSNMLISSGHMFEKIERGDSIRDPITRKFDIVLANPPFGIKGLKYDDFDYGIKQEYLPIKSTNAISLFIQAVIYILKIDGKCGIVLPDGKDLFNTKDKTLIAIREYLLKTCNLKEVIHLPAGVFSNTSIKTCIFYFIKKKEGTEVITVKTSRKTCTYEFLEDHQTTSVGFYECKTVEDLNNNNKSLVIDVPIEKIAANGYSLNYAEYIEKVKEDVKDGISLKTFGELFDFETGKIQATKCDDSGEFTFITNADNKHHSSYSLDGENLFICKINASKVVFKTKIKYNNGKCSFSSLMSRLIPKTDDISLKYMYYYLNSRITDIEVFNKGLANKTLDIELLSSSFMIPIPSIERQQEIVKRLDFIYEKSYKTSIEKIEELKILKNVCLEDLKYYHNIEIKTLGEVCEIQNGSQLDKKDINIGEIPIFGGGMKIVGYHNNYNRNGNETIVCGTGSAGYINYNHDNKFWASQCFTMKSKDITILADKYLYYYSKIILESKFMSNQKGTAIPFIRSTQISSITIPIPSIECQQEIVKECERIDKLIKDLESDIELGKKSAERILTQAIKGKPAAKN